MLKIFLFLIFCAFPFGVSFSQEHQKPTTVFGEAQTPEGTERVFILHQSNNDNNPLGNPIVASQENVDNQKEANQNTNENNNSTEANPFSDNNLENRVVPPSEAEKLGKKFQNTILEADGMVYDIQAYPTEDLKVISDPANPETIYSPNVNP